MQPVVSLITVKPSTRLPIIYKELERLIKERKIPLNAGKVLDAAKTITTIRVKTPENRKFYTKTLFLTDKHRAIQPLLELSEAES